MHAKCHHVFALIFLTNIFLHPSGLERPKFDEAKFQVSPSRSCCVSTRTPSRALPIRTRTSPTAAFAWTSFSSPARPSLDRQTSPASFSGWRQAQAWAWAGRKCSRQQRQPKEVQHPIHRITLKPSGRRPRHHSWRPQGCCWSGSCPGYDRAGDRLFEPFSSLAARPFLTHL